MIDTDKGTWHKNLAMAMTIPIVFFGKEVMSGPDEWVSQTQQSAPNRQVQGTLDKEKSPSSGRELNYLDVYDSEARHVLGSSGSGLPAFTCHEDGSDGKDRPAIRNPGIVDKIEYAPKRRKACPTSPPPDGWAQERMENTQWVRSTTMKMLHTALKLDKKIGFRRHEIQQASPGIGPNKAQMKIRI